MLWLWLVLAAVLALGAALYLAPPIITAAHRYGIVDKGDGRLKEQSEPVAYLGGLVVFVAMLVSLSLTQPFGERMLALLLGASLVVSVGLVDDLGTLVPKDKFLGQVLVGIVLVKGGVRIELDAVPWYVADLASVVWVVSVMNAFNIIDVSDGLCASVGVGVGVLMAGWLAWLAQWPEAFVAAAMAGALLGFLRFNRQPARMYLGDTGSMLVGLMCAAVVMLADWSRVNPVAALVSPLAVLGVPLFDLAFVMVCRLLLGLTLWHGSPDHFAVRMRRHGWQPRNVARLAAALTLVFGAGAFVAALGAPYVAAAVGLAGIGLCVGLGAVLWRLDPRRPPATPSVPAPTPAAREPAN